MYISLQEVLEKKANMEDTDNQAAVAPPVEGGMVADAQHDGMAAQLPPAPVERETAGGEDRDDYKQLNLDLKQSPRDTQEADGAADEKLNVDLKDSFEENQQIHEHKDREEIAEENLKRKRRREGEEEFKEEVDELDGRAKREFDSELEKGQERGEVETRAEERREEVEEEARTDREGLGKEARKVRDLKTIAAES